MPYTPYHRREAAFITGLPCFYCGVATIPPGHGGGARANTYARQHILPKRLGGKSTRENLRDCCYACNQMLAKVGDCPGAMACWAWIAHSRGLPASANGAKAAYRRAFKKAGGKNSRMRKRKNRQRMRRRNHQNNAVGAPFVQDNIPAPAT